MIVPFHTAPNNLGPSWQRYIERGTPVGGFAKALLCNDLTEAVLRSDKINESLIVDHVRWLWEHFPYDAWRSEANYLRVLHEGGMKGVLPAIHLVVEA